MSTFWLISRDQRALSGAHIPRPNINAKSITAFLTRQKKRSNYLATAQPRLISLHPSHGLPTPRYSTTRLPTMPEGVLQRRGRLWTSRGHPKAGPSTSSSSEQDKPPKLTHLLAPNPVASPAVPSESAGIPVLVVNCASPINGTNHHRTADTFHWY